jgi:Phage terminase, small subunit
VRNQEFTVSLSSDPSSRSVQLANLRPAPPAPPGNNHAERHGAHKTLPSESVAAAIYDELANETPLREQDGALPAADRAAVELLSVCLARLKSIGQWIEEHGALDGKGKPRPVIEVERRLRAEARDHLRDLGLTPRARLALGIALQRGSEFDLAQVLSDLEDER